MTVALLSYRPRMIRVHVLGMLMCSAWLSAGCGSSSATAPTAPSAATVMSVAVTAAAANAASFQLSATARLSDGNVLLDTSKSGYQTLQSPAVAVSANTTLDIFLFATPPQDATGKTATGRCVDGSWTWSDTRADACLANQGLAYPVCPGSLCVVE